MRAYHLIALLCAPVLLGQAFFVRRKVQQLPEAAGDRTGRIGDGAPLRLLIIGDSSAAGVGVDTQEQALLGQVVSRLAAGQNVSFRLLAQTGARTKDAFGWLDGLDETFDVAVIALGANDVTKGTALSAFLTQQQHLWQRLQDEFGVRQILVTAMPPIDRFPALPQPMRLVLGQRAKVFSNALAPQIQDAEGVELLNFTGDFDAHDMAVDGFHPGPPVYAAWADATAARISKVSTAA